MGELILPVLLSYIRSLTKLGANVRSLFSSFSALPRCLARIFFPQIHDGNLGLASQTKNFKPFISLVDMFFLLPPGVLRNTQKAFLPEPQELQLIGLNITFLVKPYKTNDWFITFRLTQQVQYPNNISLPRNMVS